MKIAHLVSTFPPYHGGMGNTCYDQVQELFKSGYDITVLTPQYATERLKIKDSRFKIVYLKPFSIYGNAAFVPQIIKYLKNFDVVHFHWPFIGGAEVILFWRIVQKFLGKFTSNIRVNQRTHPRESAFIVQYQMDLIGAGWQKWFFDIYQRLFLPLMVKAADKIIVSSFDYAQHSRLRGSIQKCPDKFVEIPLGVDIDKFRPQEKSPVLLQKYNLQPSDQIILFVGGLDKAHYFKGLDILIQAAKKLQATSYKLIIVGDGDLRPTYEKLARDLGIEEKVIFVGRVSDKELPDYYNLADIFVLPSTTQSEAFGLVLLEAMACAKTIIVSDLPGPRTLVKDNFNGLLARLGDMADLAAKIKFLLENKELAGGQGKAGRKLVEQKYSWTIVAQKLDEIYKNL